MRGTISNSAALAVLGLAALASLYTAVGRHYPEATTSAATNIAARIGGPYFSDGDRVGDRVVDAISRSQKTIDVAMYSLTEPAVAAALEAAARRGVRIRIVADGSQSADRHSEVPYLEEAGIQIRLSGGYRGQRSLMHDKFAVFDRRVAETGSFNWTTSADDFNYENAIFITDPPVAERFEDEFERIWSRAQ